MTEHNWDQGGQIKLKRGDSATSRENLSHTQLYGMFLYNSAQNDTDATVHVESDLGSHSIEVPGTTGDKGLASIMFFYGGDTKYVKVSIRQDAPPTTEITAFLASRAMPIDTTGFTNQELSNDGKWYGIDRFYRFYAVPPSRKHQWELTSPQTAFSMVRFEQNRAEVLVVKTNPAVDLRQRVKAIGRAKDMYTTDEKTSSVLKSQPFWGSGNQMVWMNADSSQNSNQTGIRLYTLD
ncbi:hypothetical protein [Actinopolyspora halophila]|uniref:hypothetical protein n=1 Tax=Actinopolyspora halophila TaxID=1850 RepID=UPI000370A8FF|nr:hypothetical protein [Actinopolyspora halophila]